MRFMVFVAAFIALATTAAQADVTATIAPKDRVTADLAQGETDRFRFHVPTPATVSVSVKARDGLLVRLRLLGPDDNEIDLGAALVKSPGPKPKIRKAPAPVAGTYTVVVERAAGAGTYRLVVNLGPHKSRDVDLRDAPPAPEQLLRLDASDIEFDATGTQLVATNMQEALGEVNTTAQSNRLATLDHGARIFSLEGRTQALELETEALNTRVGRIEEAGGDDAIEQNEALAEARLRRIAAAQERFLFARAVDLNVDGIGEPGTLRELAASVSPRTSDDGTNLGGTVAAPSQLDLGEGLNELAEWVANGYHVKLFVADASTIAIAETAASSSDTLAGSAAVGTGNLWCVYAWPARVGDTGRRTFFTNQAGVLMWKISERTSGPGAITTSNAGSALGAPGRENSIAGATPIGDQLGRDGASWTYGRPATPEFVHVIRRSNEDLAIATLRQIALAQHLFQTGDHVDVDNDGVGDFGTLRELSSAVAARTAADGTNTGGVRAPSLLAGLARLNANAERAFRGYHFKLFLPGNGGSAVEETSSSSTDTLEGIADNDLAETTWCAYAWPVEYPRTGKRTFFVNQDGTITWKEDVNMSGTGDIDTASAGDAFLAGGSRSDITGTPAVGADGRDGFRWEALE